MPLPSSGAISLNQMHVEAGGTSGTQCSIQDSDIRALIGIGPPPASLSFNQWYGASASTTVLSGNSSYVAPSQYVAEQRNLMALTPHKSFLVIGPQPYMASTTFTLNGRSTYAAMFNYFPNTGFSLHLADLTGGVRTTPSGAPTNSGWSSITITGGGNSTSFTRSSASYQTNLVTLFINGGTSASNYGGARWDWSSGTNILPASNNTTSFTLEIS